MDSKKDSSSLDPLDKSIVDNEKNFYEDKFSIDINSDADINNCAQNLIVRLYTFIDDYKAIIKPEDIYEDNEGLKKTITAIEKRFKDSGWEGDGDIGLIWLPPFLFDEGSDTYGEYVWHVKQSNNGISFLGFKKFYNFLNSSYFFNY